MAFEPFNSVGGYTLGIPPIPIINENGVATLNGLQVTGLSNLGSVGNVIILGGDNGYFLQTDGEGRLTWAPSGNGGGNVIPGGANTQVQFNDEGNFGGNAGFTYNSVTSVLSVSGNIIGNYFIGNGSQLTGIVAPTANFANFAGTITVSSQPNITSVGTLVSLDVNGNITAGNVKTDHILYANGDPYQFTTNAAGINTQVQFNSNNTFSASANFTFNISNNTLTVTNIIANGEGLTNLTGANVNGAVNLANFATTANAVAGANVSGEVANATFATNASAANTAGTVTTNAQPNITSVGTLTGLTVSGDILPGANVTYNLGSPTSRWKDLYISGNTINLNGSTISSNATDITLTNPLGGTFTVVGTGSSNTASLVNGNSGIIIQPNSEINFNVAGTNNVVVISNIGLSVNSNANITANLTSGNANLGNLATASYVNVSQVINGNIGNFTGNVIANSYQMGSGVYKFYTQSVYFSTTTSTSPNQVIWSVPVANVSAIDFTIIATNTAGNSRQQCKMSATILGSTVVYNEYAGLYINGGVGNFSVVYAGGSTPSVQLLVTPDSMNLTEYSILIAEYAS
jgi:hypothetical protein